MPFILGIICMLSIRRMEFSVALLMWVAFACFLSLVFSYQLLRANFRWRWISGLFANLSLFILGTCLVSVIEHESKPLLKETGEPFPENVFLCRMDVSPVAKTRTCVGNAVTVAKMDSIGQWHSMESKILVYFKDDSLCKSLRYGDLILISGAMQTIPGPPNPHMFSFRQYLYNRQICYQVFLEPGRWQKVGMAASNPVRSVAEICREKFLETFRKFKVEGQDFALVSALLLGRTEYLEKETMQEFSHAGVIHVLSVSGLHVGIMYVVADKMFFFLKRGRRSRKLHQILILGCIWAYAFIAGLPASVVRAALMFSLIGAGKMLKRSSEGYNILAVAAFFQLWINPYEITQVGFQLSYVAVLGIFAFYKPLNEMITPFNKIFAGVWSILAVSMAAQLATFPLACHYFNMFPVYFLLTNLIVVPLAAVVTYFAVFLLVAGSMGLTFEWLAWPLKWSLRFMSGSVELIQSWPGAVFEPVVLTPGQAILIYTAIFGLFIFAVLAYRRGAFIILGSLLLFSILSGRYLYEKLKTSEIAVYQVSGHTAIDFIHDRKAFFICDSLLSADPGKIEFQIKPNRVNQGINDIQVIKAERQDPVLFEGTLTDYPFIYFRGKRIVMIDDKWKNGLPEEVIPCDLAIFSGNPRIRPEELKTQVSISKVIIDSSVPFYRAEQLMQSFHEEEIPCHSVRHSGAFVIRWI
jgi:competence protein ComEC